MAVPLPNLDDRRWADLVSEALSVIPVYAPEWTDVNATDPGVTLVELLAWVAEADLYRLNRISDRDRHALLRLIGIRPEPPRPARAVASCVLTQGAVDAELKAGTELSGLDAGGVETRFRSTADVSIDTVTIERLFVDQNGTLVDITPQHRRGEAVGAFGSVPRVGASLVIALSAALHLNRTTSFYVRLAEEPPSLPYPSPPPGKRGLTLGSGRPPTNLVANATGSASAGVPEHHSARVRWETLGMTGNRRTWIPANVEDDTRSLTLSGGVRVRATAPMIPATLPGTGRDYYYLRCRVTSGAFDAPPQLAQLLIHAVPLEQSVPVGKVGGPLPDGGGLLIGHGTGAPWQYHMLAAAPVVESSFELFTQEDGEWRAWTLRDDFIASRPSDAHLLLDAQAGTLQFGDGAQGRVPPLGAPIVVRYQATRAGDGNLRDDAITSVAAQHVAVARSSTVAPGRAAETLATAIGRARQLREAPLRAVTLDDYEHLARTTPGTRIARVTARANIFPGLDCVSAPGNIVVCIVPAMPVPQPTPSPGLIAAVAARLATRRLIGTRVSVVGPSYLEIAVRARVRAFPTVATAALNKAIVEALARFFDPLVGGPESTGWPFGRDVYRSEVLETIDGVPGVDHVVSLELIAGGCPPQCGNICLQPTWLVSSGRHEIEVI
jgi:predicted phage baseplate assembly protein